jgi:hypothetical protein
MELIKSRYGDHPDFDRILESLDMLSHQTEEELQAEKKILSCYGEHLDKVCAVLNTLTTEQIAERYAELKSDLFSTSMAFFSSISEQLTRFLKRVKMRLRGLSADIKVHLLNYMRDWWIEKIYPVIQYFIDKIDAVAKLLGVDSYSVSLNYAFITVGFTFKSTLKK